MDSQTIAPPTDRLQKVYLSRGSKLKLMETLNSVSHDFVVTVPEPLKLNLILLDVQVQVQQLTTHFAVNTQWLKKLFLYYFVLLVEINAWSVPGDLHHRCGSTNQNCAMDENGHKACQHDKNLEHISPDHGFYATLVQIMEETQRKTQHNCWDWYKNWIQGRIFIYFYSFICIFILLRNYSNTLFG